MCSSFTAMNRMEGAQFPSVTLPIRTHRADCGARLAFAALPKGHVFDVGILGDQVLHST